MDTIQTIIVALIGGGLVGFVQFLIARHDAKKDKNAEVLDAIKQLDGKIGVLEGKIDEVDRKYDERSAISSRVRILRFEDELQDGKRHSQDLWQQTIIDCDAYDKYCSKNEDFRNGIASASVEHIREEYKKRLEKHDWR